VVAYFEESQSDSKNLSSQERREPEYIEQKEDKNVHKVSLVGLFRCL
jgi:hypothetical protein